MRRFAFVLAGHLGMTVGELERRMLAAEFMEWGAFADLDPFGSHREDWRSAQICTVLANAFGAKVDVTDFMLEKPKPVAAENALETLKKHFERVPR